MTRIAQGHRSGRSGTIPSVRWIVDGNNVMGSRPDGWWRDRDGAARRLAAEVAAFADATGTP
jgi:hypothetical protein